jgi:hypothetical protein
MAPNFLGASGWGKIKLNWSEGLLGAGPGRELLSISIIIKVLGSRC